MTPTRSLQPTPDRALISAVADHVIGPAWLTLGGMTPFTKSEADDGDEEPIRSADEWAALERYHRQMFNDTWTQKDRAALTRALRKAYASGHALPDTFLSKVRKWSMIRPAPGLLKNQVGIDVGNRQAQSARMNIDESRPSCPLAVRNDERGWRKRGQDLMAICHHARKGRYTEAIGLNRSRLRSTRPINNFTEGPTLRENRKSTKQPNKKGK